MNVCGMNTASEGTTAKCSVTSKRQPIVKKRCSCHCSYSRIFGFTLRHWHLSPFIRSHRGFTPTSAIKASSIWIFCRFVLTSERRSGNLTIASVPNSGYHPDLPEVSSTTFDAHLPNLRPRTLMDMDFVIFRQLVQPELPRIRFLSARPQRCYTLP